jgi:hypothetical protein
MRHASQSPIAEHVVCFYATDQFLVERIADFVADGLRAGEHVLAIATSAHWTSVAERLDVRGVAHGHAAHQGRLIVADAETVLDQITVDGVVSANRFGEMFDRLLDGRAPWRIYGEVVALLAARGDVEAAAAIEKLGHELSRMRGMPILCAYHTPADSASSRADLAPLAALHDRSVREPAAKANGSGHFHAVRFYKDEQSLARVVCDFIAEGFVLSLPGVIIATPAHRAAILDYLSAKGADVAGLQAAGDLTMLDADTLLEGFMVDGMPDAARFRSAMTPVLEKASKGRRDRVIRAYGEMVDVLWKAGHTVAAIRLEMLWNDLAHTHEFALLCGYSIGNFYKDAARQQIARQHTHVLPDAGGVDAVN